MVIRETIHGYLCFKEKKEHEILGRILCRILCRIFTHNPHSINEIDKTLCRICVFAYIFVTNATGTAKKSPYHSPPCMSYSASEAMHCSTKTQI